MNLTVLSYPIALGKKAYMNGKPGKRQTRWSNLHLYIQRFFKMDYILVHP